MATRGSASGLTSGMSWTRTRCTARASRSQKPSSVWMPRGQPQVRGKGYCTIR